GREVGRLLGGWHRATTRHPGSGSAGADSMARTEFSLCRRQRTFSEFPAIVSRLRLISGDSKVWKEFGPRDAVGINAVTRILISHDQKSYVYSYRRVLSELLTVDGWR